MNRDPDDIDMEIAAEEAEIEQQELNPDRDLSWGNYEGEND